MGNGRPGDSPWSDFFGHHREVFPEDIAAMLRAIDAVSPRLIEHLHHPDMWDWEAGRDLDVGRAKLRQIILENGIPFQAASGPHEGSPSGSRQR